MANLFGIKKPQPDPAQQKAQRKQARAVDQQTADEAKELGARRRLKDARRRGSRSLFAQTGAAGVSRQETLG